MSETRSYRDTDSRRFGIAVSAVLHAAVIGTLVFFWPGHRERFAHAPKVMSVFVPQVPRAPVEPPRPRPVAPAAKPRSAPPAPAPTMAMPVLVPMELPVAAPITPRASVETPSATVAMTAETPPAIASLAVTPPRHDAAYLSNPPPRYPPIARRNGEQGRVVLRVLVTTDGLAETVEIRTSSGSERLDRAALETVRNWRFVPARQGDRTVSAWVLVPITFSLDA